MVWSSSPPPPFTRVEQHIHFWLGEDTSTDEAAIAAYKVSLSTGEEPP